MSSTKKLHVYKTKTFFLDPFVLRQWDDKEYKGTKIEYDKNKFIEKIEDIYQNGEKLRDGYAPFCKHLIIKNFIGAVAGAMEITKENYAYLKHGYIKRRPEELAVLSRWFSSEDIKAPMARYIDIILYSREQIIKEHKSMPNNDEFIIPDFSPWAIISIKGQMEDYETPMNPITMMRNALGTEYGGSGEEIDIKKYEESVFYWETHAIIC